LYADIDYPRELARQGKAVQDSEFRYAVGHLVVWAPNGSGLDRNKLGIRAVADPSVRKVAVANPRTVPYGRAAEAALTQLGVYDEVRGRLVFGENFAQAAQFVESGAADVGLIALSLALSPTMKDKGRYWPVPLDPYPRLDQGGVILTGRRTRRWPVPFGPSSRVRRGGRSSGGTGSPCPESDRGLGGVLGDRPGGGSAQ